MKKFLATCAAGASVVALTVAGPAVAAPASKHTEGKTVSFASGKLKVKAKKGGTAVYVVGKATGCGYSRGQMGDEMPCSNLKKSKYMKKSVSVTWHADKKGRRVADLVAVHL